MRSSPSTADQIIAASLKLFNEQGYAATSLSEIAKAVGVSQGNLSYHFPTKRDLVRRIEADVRGQAQARRARPRPRNLADAYVERLLFGMKLVWNHRFLLRDRAQYNKGPDTPLSEWTASFEEFRTLMVRMDEEGLFREGAVEDLDALTRAIWIIGRYWMDYLHDAEGRKEITWQDQKRCIEHHFAVLLPCLTESAKKQFEAALAHAAQFSEVQA